MNGNNEFEASRQWATRPSDQRFWNIEEMHQAVVSHRERTVDVPALLSSLSVRPTSDQDLWISTGEVEDQVATMSNFSFGQICERVKGHKPYLTTLPAPIVADCLNYGLDKYRRQVERAPHSITFEIDGNDTELRCIASEIYNRIWNQDITQWLRQLPERGWRVPPARPCPGGDPRARPATEADVLDDKQGFLSVKIGDMIAPAGLYASDRDMFAFFVNEEFKIDDGAGNPMSRAFYVSNAEVPGRSFRAKFFGYEHVCGNHIIWGAKLLGEVRVRHVGDQADRALEDIQHSLKHYAETTGKVEEDAIAAARRLMLGSGKDKVIDEIGRARVHGLTQNTLSKAYDVAANTVDMHKASPNSAWGMVQGLTRISQNHVHADAREVVDTAASRLIERAAA
jgi:hypothetical protein